MLKQPLITYQCSSRTLLSASDFKKQSVLFVRQDYSLRQKPEGDSHLPLGTMHRDETGQTRGSFLNLPPEIRLGIYRLLLWQDAIITS